MQFREQQAIYLQIADYICERILRHELSAEDKIPSVRDLAISIAVNPNTVVRTYAYLEEQGIIYKQRGIGYFLTQNSYNKTLILRKNFFMQRELPRLAKTLKLLNVNFNDLKNLLEKSSRNPIERMKQK